jgi:16S rRNA (guanine527-N7)-methyltransferase
MSAADRKVVHDAVNDLDGVASTSEGEDPYRRVVILRVSDVPPALRAVLEDGQRRGVIGPGPIESAVDHALQFFSGLAPRPGWRCVDLGSGGGLPGLPLALAHPATSWVLLDAWEARVDALRRAIRSLGLSDRVEAVHARAEDAGRVRSGVGPTSSSPDRSVLPR